MTLCLVMLATVLVAAMLLPVALRVGHVPTVTECGAGAEHRVGRRLGAFVVALIGGFASGEFRFEGKAAVGPRVVELDEVPVLVLRHECVVGREEDVVPVGADR